MYGWCRGEKVWEEAPMGRSVSTLVRIPTLPVHFQHHLNFLYQPFTSLSLSHYSSWVWIVDLLPSPYHSSPLPVMAPPSFIYLYLLQLPCYHNVQSTSCVLSKMLHCRIAPMMCPHLDQCLGVWLPGAGFIPRAMTKVSQWRSEIFALVSDVQ